jgi:hypothetical protein
MGRGAEAYLQMWERASGIPKVSCDRLRQRFLTAHGFPGRLELGQRPKRVLRRAGQPVNRTRALRWCAASRSKSAKAEAKRAKPQVAAVFTRAGKVGLIQSTLRKHRADGIRPRMPARRLRSAKALGRGLYVRDAGGGRKFVYGTRRGRVGFVAVAASGVAGSERVLRGYVRRAR